jgi:cytochrome c oxidase assembly protein subunit 15
MKDLKANPRYSRWPNRIAKLLALVVFPLIWAGGLVTTSDAGMAVPDWPNTYNYNMFAYPIRDWFLGPWDLFVEHGHRLLGSLSGMIAIVLCVVTWITDRRPVARNWSLLVLALVIGQGILGGQRVVQDDRALALIHGCVGPAFFATVVVMIVLSSSWWVERQGMVADRRFQSTAIAQAIAPILVIVSYGQLILGACMRHISDSAAPSVYSVLVIAHLATAGVVFLVALATLYVSLTRNFRGAGIRASAIALTAMVIVQIGLGITSYVLKFGWPAWMGGWGFAAQYIVPEKTFWQMNWITLHVAVGSLILATATYHAVRIGRAVFNRTLIERP